MGRAVGLDAVFIGIFTFGFSVEDSDVGIDEFHIDPVIRLDDESSRVAVGFLRHLNPLGFSVQDPVGCGGEHRCGPNQFNQEHRCRYERGSPYTQWHLLRRRGLAAGVEHPGIRRG